MDVRQERVIEIAPGMEVYFSPDGYCVIVLGSQHCYHVPIPINHTGELTFLLENDLPIDAESMSYCVLEAGERRAAVVTNGSRLQGLLGERFAVDELNILAVVPEAFLLLSGSAYSNRGTGVVVHCARDGWDLLFVEDRAVFRWDWAPPSSELVKAILAERFADTGDKCDFIRFATSITDCTNCRNAFEGLECNDVQPVLNLDWKSDAVSAILGGFELPVVNFRSGSLKDVDPLLPARRALRGVGVATIGLMLLLAAGLFWRANLYAVVAANEVAMQEVTFAELFPSQSIPVGMMNRVESEYRRLLATRGEAQIPGVESTLPVMLAFWNALSSDDDVQYHIMSLEFAPGRLEHVQGSTKSYEDLESLRRTFVAAGFRVPPVSAVRSAIGTSWRYDQVDWEEPSKASSGDAP